MATWFGLGILVALWLGGCGAAPPPPVLLMTPGAKVIYADAEGHGVVFLTCYRGDRLYLTNAGRLFVVGGACPFGDP